MLMWNFSLKTNQFKAEYISVALFIVRSGRVCQSNHFIWDFTGGSVVQAAKRVQKKSVWSGFIGFFVISSGRLQHDTDKS